MTSITTFNSGSQNYDRLLEADSMNTQTRGSGVGSPNGGDGLGPVPDITAPQKMISAMSGSLLTSLLGEPESYASTVC